METPISGDVCSGAFSQALDSVAAGLRCCEGDLCLPAGALVLPALLPAGSFPTVPLPADRGSSRLPGLESSLPGLV